MQDQVTEAVHNNKFFIGSAVIVASFILTRITYYFDFPFIQFSSDSASFIAPALRILDSSLPLFDQRSPGYPLFISLIIFSTKNPWNIIIVQSLITLLSSIYLFRTIVKYYEKISVCFSIGIAVFISSSIFLLLENNILSDQLFACLMMVNSAFLINAIKLNSISYWTLVSVSAGVLILVRPVAVFFIPLLLLFYFYFFKNNLSIKYYISATVPVLLILLALCIYNYIMINRFTISLAGNLSFSVLTVYYMEDEGLPDNFAAVVRSVSESLPSSEKKYIINGNDPNKINDILVANCFRAWNMTGRLINSAKDLDYIQVEPVLKKITDNSVSKHPLIYLKIVISNIYSYFSNIGKTIKYYDESASSFKNLYINHQHIKELSDSNWEQFYSDKSAANEVINFYNENLSNEFHDTQVVTGDVYQDSLFKKIHILFEQFINVIFRNAFWVILFTLSFIISIYKNFKTNFRNKDYFITFIFPAMLILYSLLISSVGVSILRYSFVTDYILYFSVPFLLILLNFNSQIQKP